MNKRIKINVAGIDELDEKTLGMLIDGLVDFYVDKFGLTASLDEPDKPEYDVENLDVVKDYLKKFRLQ